MEEKNAIEQTAGGSGTGGCPHCGGARTTPRDEAEKAKLLNRLSRIEGQIRGLKAMVEADAYCVDIITQGAAAAAALQAFDRALLLRHIDTCVSRDLAAGKPEAARELEDLLKKLLK